MARTLSPASPITIVCVAIVSLSLHVHRGLAETPRQTPAPTNAKPPVRTAPVAQRSEPHPSAKKSSITPTRNLAGPQGSATARPATGSFRNPFSTEADSPHADFLLLPGPRSRWRSTASILNPRDADGMAIRADKSAPTNTATPPAAPTILKLTPPLTDASPETTTTAPDTTPPTTAVQTDQPSSTATERPDQSPAPANAPVPAPLKMTAPPSADRSVKSAIVSGANDPADASQQLYDQNVPLLSDEPESSTLRIATPSALEPPDPTRYSNGPVNRPVWLGPRPAPQREATQAPSTGRDRQRLAERTAPARPAPVIEQTALEQVDAGPEHSTVTVAQAPDAESETAVISDFDDSPSGWLVEAQEAARSAHSLDELLNVTRLCERVMNADSHQKLAPFARKLAAWAHNRRGELLIESDQHTGALAEFQIAIEYDPQNSLAIHNRAVTLAQQNNFDAALVDFNRVIELNPGLAVAYRNRAELLAAQGNADEAIADYTRAIESMPDDAELYRARAHAFQQLDEFERALADIGQSIRIAPNAAEGYAQRGNLLADRGDFERALEDLSQAIAIDPKAADVQRSLAWIKATCPDERLRDAFQALSAAHLAVKLSTPDDYLAFDVLAAAHANAGEFDKAVAAQQQAINVAPADAVPSMQSRLNLYEHRRPYRVGR